jgi:amino-acid N-acetyltransferase
MAVRLRQATADDLPRVERLLVDAGLTIAGVPQHIGDFLLAEEDGQIIGSAALERYGIQGLLRSVAVTPAHRSRGLARELIARILDGAARSDVQAVYLFTNTASDYFRRFGFVTVGRDDVAQPVRASAEYGECCADAQVMMLPLAEVGRWR